ncbi:MAG: RHS repeat-associated core domain-containing protein [Candidatus Pacebacteria bacterium]|nr:RHS repeat-associated core domain-containing protein [Candidatus Paceibacterota bacterium]
MRKDCPFRHEYDSFGNFRDSEDDMSQPYAYTGREYDEETGLYYYRARYYDSSVGRFVNRDPIIGFAVSPQTLNRYVYVTNNPVRYGDPTGEYEIHISFTTNIGLGVAGGNTWSFGVADDGSYGLSVGANVGGISGIDASVGLGLGYSNAETWSDTEGIDVYGGCGGKFIFGGDINTNFSKGGYSGTDISVGVGLPIPSTYVVGGVNSTVVVMDRNIKQDLQDMLTGIKTLVIPTKNAMSK